MDQTKKLIIGGVVAVLVVVGLYLGLGSASAKQPEKNAFFSEVEPKFDVKDLKDMAPQDGKVLVAFQGFAKYLSSDYGKKVYLALAPVTEINVVAPSNQTDPQLAVALKSEHGLLTVAFEQDKDEKIRIKRVSLKTDDGDKEKSCEIKDAGIVYSNKSYFECMKPITLSCEMVMEDENGKQMDMKVAQLTVSNIRAEVNGKPDDHKAGKFTNPVGQCT